LDTNTWVKKDWKEGQGPEKFDINFCICGHKLNLLVYPNIQFGEKPVLWSYDTEKFEWTSFSLQTLHDMPIKNQKYSMIKICNDNIFVIQSNDSEGAGEGEGEDGIQVLAIERISKLSLNKADDFWKYLFSEDQRGALEKVFKLI
jgi:hypothetical protein